MNENKHVSHFTSFPSNQSLYQVFEREVKRNPLSVALVSGTDSLSYEELQDRSSRIANLLTRLGVRQEDFVVLYLNRSFDLISGIFGILKAGGAYVPVDVDYPRERMQFMIRDANARVILTEKSLKHKLPATDAHIICLDEPDAFLPESTPVPVTSPQKTGFRASQLAYMIYTSGSTGTPKGVMITHENVLNQLESQQAISPEPIGAMLLTCSISFDVSVSTIFWTLLQGATLVLPAQGEEKDTARLLETLVRNKITHLFTLPSLYSLLLDRALAAQLRSLQMVSVSGEVCPASLAAKHGELVPGAGLYNQYGPTETTVHATCFAFPEGFNAARAPIGKPVLNYKIFILNEQKQEVRPGETGEIYIGGIKPVVARGYWKRPQLTAERFVSLPGLVPDDGTYASKLYKTGDLARWMPDGNIEFIGRSDYQVKYRGYRIELGEIEAALSNHPAVRESVVVLQHPHEIDKQRLVAYLVLHNDRSLTVSEARHYLEISLPDYMLPSHFVFLDAMPLTTNGKIDRQALPAAASDRPVLDVNYEPPVTKLEKYIARQWEDILQVAPIGRNDKFFELGGTSIQAAQFTARWMNTCRTSLFVTTLFDHPTVAAYAAFLEKNYKEDLAALFDTADKKPLKEGGPIPSPGLSVQQIRDFEKVIPSLVSEKSQLFSGNKEPVAPIFILAPPRSGTTLLRVMLAGHPELFACNELQLLHFHTLKQRDESYTGKFALWKEGLIRAVMELKQCPPEDAIHILREFSEKGMSTRAMYVQLQKWANGKTIVDKSPSYALDLPAMKKAVRDYPNARFIHLVRHPYSMVTSFEKYHMDQVLYLKEHNYHAKELGELVWLYSHMNILEFSGLLPKQNYCRILYEDLVQEPEKTMRRMCEELHLPFHHNLLDPYGDLDSKMTDGIFRNSRSMGDTHFERKKRIDPAKANDWKAVRNDNFLCEETWKVAGLLGYPPLFEEELPEDTPEKTDKTELKNKLNGNYREHGSKENIKSAGHSESIAIIGMACRFPGADDIETFWNNLVSATDVSHQVTDKDIQKEGIPGPTLPGHVRRAYVPANPYGFDAAFFGIHPKQAALTDPQHRIFLETSYQALEASGYNPYQYEGKIGIFGGVARNTYFTNNLAGNPDLQNSAQGYQELLASESTFSVSRVAYKLNLKGPAVNVQTACSTSGVAVHLACQSLLQGDSDMVLVGGGRIQAPVHGGYQYTDGGPLSSDGKCRAFDASANGMVQGHGMAVLVLKKLDRAMADGDHIWAVIRSTAINNDGAAKTGITAPSAQGQADCIAAAIKKAGLTGPEIGYIETHGTGTFIGDPIELQGLKRAFGKMPPGTRIPIGSVKTHIGHLDAGACLAGIMQAALALYHEKLPRVMHFEKNNPQAGLDDSPFYVLKESTDWKRGARPRFAGVSSFGLGGTNAHVILEEAPPVDSHHTTSSGYHIAVLSAKSAGALQQMEEKWIEAVNREASINLSDACYTLATGRPHFPFRKAAVVNGSKGEVIRFPYRNTGPVPGAESRNVVFMFPGGGAQYVQMARDLYQTHAFFKEQVDTCAGLLARDHDLHILPCIYPENECAESADIERPSLALASLFTYEYALARLWQHWGVQPDEMIGHSMGEYTAACISGVMKLEDALGLVAFRGKLFESLEGNGGMLSVGLGVSELQPLLDDDQVISVINREDSLVVSSTAEGIERLQQKLLRMGVEHTRIHISVPAHSPWIEPMLPEFRKYLETVELNQPKIPFISNVTGTWITSEEATSADYWIRHLRQTVRFADGLRTLTEPSFNNPDQENPKSRIFLEVGPGQVLSTFARALPTLSEKKRLVIASVRHPKERVNDVEFIYKAVVRLWVNGIDIHWNNFYQEGNYHRVPLPVYPFERVTHFIPPVNKEKPFSETTDKDNLTAVSAAGESLNKYLSLQSASHMHASPEKRKDEKAPRSRMPVLIREIKQVLYELSGLEPADMDEQASFLELGFDSLFLSQAVIKFNYTFKQALSFRMLFETTPTITALAEYLDARLPEDLFQPASIPEPAPAPMADVIQVSEVAINSLPANNSGLIQLIQQQLSIMQQQIDLLKDGKQENTQNPLHPLSSQHQSGQIAEPVSPRDLSETSYTGTSANDSTDGSSTSEPIQRKTKGVTAKMNSYKTISGDDQLTEKQQKGLEKLIKNYVEKTSTSKELAQAHRQWYADPRSVTGFSKLWKEICYQIAHKRSRGSKIWDVDGNEYIDYVMSYGVALFGHMPDFIEKAITEAISDGNSIDLLPPKATEMARIICEITGYDRATLANTGTEAVLGAVRAARTATGRSRIAVFDTDYHGMIDQFLVRGVHLKEKSKTQPSSPGVPDFLVDQTLVLDYDDPNVLQKLEKEIHELAAVVIEPVQAQNPHWQHRELIREIRRLTEQHGVALVFDEIINGFRLDYRGAQAWYGVEADISAYGKSISGGLPIAAIAGRSKFMEAFDGGYWRFGDDSAPEGVISYFASTFIKNPISVAAGYAAMQEIREQGPELQKELNEKTLRFAERIREIFLRTRAPFMIQSCASFFMLKTVDGNPLNRLFHYFLRLRGVNVRERPCFISTAHTEEDFEKTFTGFELAIQDMYEAGLIEPYEGEDLNEIVRHPDQREIVTTPVDVPTTEGQREIFLSDQLSPDASRAYNIATRIRLEGPFDEAAMKKALQGLVDRHEALRTVIHEDGQMQTIWPELEVAIPVEDLRSGPAEERLQALYDEEATHHFDLQKGPLVRFRIVRLEEELTMVFIHVHHIICDGWSLGIVTRELGQMYANLTGGKAVSDNLPTGYKQLSQYASEEAALQEREVLSKNESYWLEQFEDTMPVLNLPMDFPRPSVRTFEGAVEKMTLDPARVQILKQKAARQGTTFYIFMLAAFQAYLCRIAEQDDLVIGVAAAGHNLPGNQQMVAHAINLLPVRTTLSEKMTFAEYVHAVRARVLDAFDHQQYTFGSLVKKLKLERTSSRNPLVSVAFNLDSPLDHLAFGELAATTSAIPRHFETFDTFINVKPVNEPGREGQLDLEWNFQTSLFRRETIRLRLAEFETFLNGILEEAEKPVSKLPLLPDFESRQIARFEQGELLEFPLHQCLHTLFEKQVEKTPEKIAIRTARVAVNGSDGEVFSEAVTYSDLEQKAAQLALVLKKQGVQPGDFVALCMDRSPEMLVGIYGILKAGGAYVPVDTRNPEDRIRFIWKDAGCKVLVTRKKLLKHLPAFDGAVVFSSGKIFADRQRDNLSVPSSTVTAAHPAYVIYTSGSTGKPKGVIVRHENVVQTLFAINRHLQILAGDSMFSVSSMSFDMSIPDYFLTLITGATLILAGEEVKKDGFALREALEKHCPTFMQATPATWKILMLSGWNGDPGLTAIAGGEGFSKELAREMAATCKAVWNGYGPTETTIYTTYQRITEDHLAQCPGEFAAIGSPIANVRLRILDRRGERVPIGVPGELYIGGPGVATGYLNRPELTRARFLPDDEMPHEKYYRTGDLVRYLPSGEVEFLGRVDDQVKIRGYRIELGEIEEVMKQFPGIRQSVVTVFKDATGSSQLAGYYVVDPDDYGKVTTDRMIAFLRSRLPGYMVPSFFREMDALPLNTSLKIDRKALPEPDFSTRTSKGGGQPATDGEKYLSEVWSELLGIENPGVHDDFFELGGHSLIAVQLMSRIRKDTGRKLPLNTLLQYPTIRELATKLDAPSVKAGTDTGDDSSGSLICIRKGGDKAPLYLVHGGGLHVLFYKNLVRYLDEDQPIYALQAKGLNGEEEPYDRIEDMAAHYIREIKMVNKEGPFCLAGYSLGGLIAWEMAAQLKAEGGDVPLLALFDTVAKSEWEGDKPVGKWKKKLKKAGFNLSLLFRDPSKTLEYKSNVLKMQFQHMKGKLRMAYRNNQTNEIEEGYIPYGKKVYEKALEAYDAYELKPLNIHVDLFKAGEQMFYLHDPMYYGWDQFAKEGITVHKIAGNHLTLFDEPHGREVAEALKVRLEEVDRVLM